MARFCVGRIAATLAVVAVIAASAGDDTTRVEIHGARDDDVSATRRRHVQSLIYHVDEHLPVGSLVGDLRADLRSTCDDEGQLADCEDLPMQFRLLHQRPAAAALFDVQEATGVLRSSGVVDREEICFRREIVCSVVLEVAVHYAAAGAFDVAVVEVSNTSLYMPFMDSTDHNSEIRFNWF